MIEPETQPDRVPAIVAKALRIRDILARRNDIPTIRRNEPDPGMLDNPLNLVIGVLNATVHPEKVDEIDVSCVTLDERGEIISRVIYQMPPNSAVPVLDLSASRMGLSQIDIIRMLGQYSQRTSILSARSLRQTSIMPDLIRAFQLSDSSAPRDMELG